MEQKNDKNSIEIEEEKKDIPIIPEINGKVEVKTETIRKKPFTIYGVEFVYLFILGIVCAFLGWLGENTFKLISQGFIDSRFHILPLIPAYALIVFALHIFMGSPSDLTFFGKKVFKKTSTTSKVLSNIICYVIICLSVFLGELVVGNLWELCFGVQLWDYTGYFLNITQYTSLFTTLMYGTVAFLLFQILNPCIRFVKKHISYNVAKWVTIIVGSLMILDSLRMVITIMITHEATQFWKLVFFVPSK